MPSCANCGKPSAVKLSYNSTDLCEQCFCRQFENRVRQANKDFGMLRLNERIAVGISGGKDSGAMLYVLSKMKPGIRGLELLPVIVDEGIDSYRVPSIKCAEELCDLLNLHLEIRRFSEHFKPMDEIMEIRGASNKRNGENLHRSCTYCGVFRKNLLNRAARELQSDKLAVGHNSDDVAQTFLMNFLHDEPGRWTRFEPANGARDGFVPRIKPLIYNPESESRLYCQFKGIPFYDCKCPYSSESFRGEVKRFLRELEAKFPGTTFNALNAYLHLYNQISSNELSNKGKSDDKPAIEMLKCAKCGENSGQETCMACRLLSELHG